MFSHNLFYTFILCNILHNNLENKYFSKIKNYSRKPWKQQAGKSGKLSENYERHGAARYSPRRASPTHIVLSWVKSYYRSYYSSQEHCSWSCFFFKRHLNESECRFINEKWEIIPESGVPTGKQICFFELCIYLCLALFFFHILKLILVCVRCVPITNLKESVLSKWVTETELRSSGLAARHLTSILDILFTQKITCDSLLFSFWKKSQSLVSCVYKTDVIQEAKDGLR